MTIDAIQADFDRLARLDTGIWSHNSQYHSFLLQQLPVYCENSLEIGCGTGSFAHLLAKRSKHVVALDLSPIMLEVAKERSEQYPNIEFLAANALSWTFPLEQFDCIASIAAFHHMPLEIILPKVKRSLKAGGVLLVLDLCKFNILTSILTAPIAVPAQFLLRLSHTGKIRQSREVREAWAAHGRNDHYIPISNLRCQYNKFLPNAKIRKHLLWRYSLVWKKPGSLEGIHG